MNTTDNFDKLREQWRSFNPITETVTPREREMERRAMLLRASSGLDRYRRMSMRMIALCCFGIVTACEIVRLNTILGSCLIAFFIVLAIFQGWLIREINAIRPGEMTVSECIGSIIRIQRILRLKRIAGITVGVFLVSAMAVIYTDEFGATMLVPIAVGILVGAPLGYMFYRRSNRILETLKNDLGATE